MTIPDIRITHKMTTDLGQIELSGHLGTDSISQIWKETHALIRQHSPKKLILDMSGVTYCDMAGIAFIINLQQTQALNNYSLEIKGLRNEFNQLLLIFQDTDLTPFPKSTKQKLTFIERIGFRVAQVINDLVDMIAFVGELFTVFVKSIRHPQKVRWKQVFYIAEKAGIDALPIVLLISFLIGLIMAFQSAIPMSRFGAEIFVADLISLSMLRELGPLMTAIVLTGRSGSSFAAELGTMKVNEEIDALITMGIDPVQFLVLIRVLAAIIVTPLLTIYADIIGIAGGSIPLLLMDYPFVTYCHEITRIADYLDFTSGMIKSVIFGFLVAAIGCLRGLQTKSGASAVGESTTSSVVTGIILIVLTDGLFSVVFYYIGL